MIEILRKIFGLQPAPDYKQLVKKGAEIIDVRSPQEFKTGHIKSSLNIPVESLSRNLGKIKKDKILITCCASGIRSGRAKSILKAQGYDNVYNGGSWPSLENKIR